MAAGEERRKQALLQGPIRRVQRRLNREIWARGLVVPAWCAGTAIALYRFAFREHVLLAGAVVAAAGIAAWIWRTRPALVPLARAAALTDRSVGAGGLLLTRLEVPVGEWELSLNERVRAVKPPEVSVRGPLSRVALAALFTAVALWVPLPPKPAARVNAAAASKLAQVEAKAEALAKEKPLPEEQAELARLRDELAQGRFDAADWEAADGVSGAMEQKAAQAAADLSKAEAAAKALEEGLAKGVPQDEEARERDALERALMALNGAEGAQGDGAGQDGAEGAQGDGQEQGKDGDGEQGKDGDGEQGKDGNGGQGQGQQANGQGQQGKGQQAAGQQNANGKGKGSGARGNKKAISDLRRALASRQRDLAKAFGQGTGQGRDGSEGQDGSGNGQGQGGRRGQHASRAVRQGNGQGTGGEDGDGMGGAGPGRGGDHRPLVYGGQAEVNPDRLKFTPLPKGQGGEAGELWGLQGADPKPDVEHARGEASGAAAQGERAPGTRTGPLLPRNRELVRRYFDSK